METFPAFYFTYSTRYPESGSRSQFARSYTYTIEAEAPDQRTFQLELKGMQYFVNDLGEVSDTPHPERNMAVLESFYSRHRLALSFNFEHPIYGVLTCKFNRPLDIPKGIPGGNGVLETLTVELLEIV